MSSLKQSLRNLKSKPKLLGLIVAVLFGIAGLSYLVLTQAAASAGPIVGIGNKCLDNTGGSKRQGSTVKLMTCNNASSQTWRVDTTAQTIVNSNGKCLVAASREVQASVTTTKCNNRSDLQKWIVDSLTNTIVNVGSGLCLDSAGANTTDGNPIWMYTCNGTEAQVWKPQSTSVQAPSITTFTATPISVANGGTSVLNWSTANTTTCIISPGGPVDTLATSWTTPSLTLAGTATYSLTCKNSVGATVTKTVNVEVASAPVPPPVTGTKTLFGACPVNPGGESLAAATTVVTKWGGKPAIRQFNGGTLTWNATPAGTSVHRSYKPATSVTDIQIDTLLKAADANALANGVKHILTFYHEPDNDGLSATDRATRITLINRLHERKVALGLKNVQTSVIFTGGFFASYGTQANRDLWNGVKGDLVGLDADGVHTTQDKYPTATDYVTKYDDEVAGVKKFMATNGFTGWTVPEFGTSRATYFDPTGTKRAAWMKYWGEYFAANGAVHVEWYDYGLTTFDDTAIVGTPEFDTWKAMVAKNTL